MEQRLSGVFVKEISVDLVNIITAGTTQRKMAYQQIWPRTDHDRFRTRRLIGFAEHIMPNNCFTLFLRHTWNHVTIHISATDRVLELNVVSHGIHDQIMLNQPANERPACASRVSQIHTRSGTDDFTVADNPVPGGTPISDTYRRLSGAMAHDFQIFQCDVMR